MRYVSTRSRAAARPFSDILLEGLAPDGGLYLPEHYPQVDAATLTRWRGVLEQEGYAALAFEVTSLFIDDIPAADLRGICERAYTAETFAAPSVREIVPATHLDGDLWIGHLSDGPTAAFKDMAMQLLGEFFEYELARRGQVLNILGATSGDTGSSAEYAMRGRQGIRVFMLTPAGRMTPFQQAQMFGLDDPGIINIALDGVFDDCQDIVKGIGADAEFKAQWHIGAVNSINWARLLAQVVYYVALWLRVSGEVARERAGAQRENSQGENAESVDENTVRVNFSVPTGNFGDIAAGHIARSMGVPLGALVCATNENDVLDEFFRTGHYRPRSARETVATSSPSMDISRASNFERFVFDLVGRDPERTAELFAQAARDGSFDLGGDAAFARIADFGFLSGSSTHQDRVATIARTHEELGQLVDPHTADALTTARRLHDEGTISGPTVVLETALPVKFADTIREAIGEEPPTPQRFVGIEDLERHVLELPNDVDAVRRLIEQRGLQG